MRTGRFGQPAWPMAGRARPEASEAAADSLRTRRRLIMFPLPICPLEAGTICPYPSGKAESARGDQGAMKKPSGIGIAVIGSGRIGTLRARLAAKHPAVRFLAVADKDPKRAQALAEQAGADFHTGSNEAAINHPDVT